MHIPVPTPLLIFGLFIFISGLTMLYIVSKNPSDKHGHALRDVRKKITGGIKTSSVTKAVGSSIKLGRIKLMDKVMPTQKPVYQQSNNQQQKGVTTQVQNTQPTQNSKPKRGITDAENAEFYYDTKSADPNINCGDWRLGDTYDGQYVAFTVIPYTYQGKLYLGLEHPHIVDYSQPTYQKSSEPNYYERVH